MSELLMRNYQKLIKIKKGPKVKDLLITVPCKSCIIRSLQSWPNTVEKTGKMHHRTALCMSTLDTMSCKNVSGAAIQARGRCANWRIGQAGLLLVNR